MFVALALSVLSFTASAQTYAGGTYTTTPVLAGSAPYNWNNPALPIWSGTTGAPPNPCSNCLIQLIGPGVIHLNTSVTLTNNSSLVIGPGVTLEVDNSSASSLALGNNVLMSSSTSNTLVLTDNTSTLNVANGGTYDGVLVSYGSGSYLKFFGNNGLVFVNSTPEDNLVGYYKNTATGAATFNSSSGILPIVLTNFNAALNQGAVDLSWTTELESNSDHFAIQRSSDAGATWTVIGTVAAAGNSNVALNYTYTDNKPAQGTNEYRLQLVDKDGKYTYSDVESIRLGTVTSVSLYPNPAHDYVNVTLGGTTGETMLIRLFNQNGQVLQEKSVTNAGGTIVPLAVSSYPNGDYIIVVSAADGSRQVSKLMITK